MNKKIIKFSLILALIFSIIAISIDLLLAIILGLFWLSIIFLFIKLKIRDLFVIFIIFTMFLSSFYVCISAFSKKNKTRKEVIMYEYEKPEEHTGAAVLLDDQTYPAHQAIFIKGKTGSLNTKEIATSSQFDDVLYLVNKDDEAEFNFNLSEDGKYTLYVNLSDDGKYSNGQRDVDIMINNEIFNYHHISNNTNGWKWFQIGVVELKKGKNLIRFTKQKTTKAPYIMDALKLIPE